MQVSVNSAATWMAPGKKEHLLGDIMLAARVITQHQLEEALEYQKETGGKIGRILIEKGYISEQALKDCLDSQIVARNGH